MNRGFCEQCGRLVPASQQERDGAVYLVKDCGDCGPTETLISSDARRYYAKRSLDGEHEEPRGCGLNCLSCNHKQQPSFIFIDITNRCNSNCPICINNTPSMGFLFEPPMEYFERIFDRLAELDPKPAVQLFGGEPTVRADLFQIIAMAKERGLRVRVVTNGLRLASEPYCRQLVQTGATVLFAYDGLNPETYRVLRGNEKHLRVKQRALDNLATCDGAKVALMTCVAKGFNDHELGEIVQFCHERRDFIRGIYFLPLAQTWSADGFALQPERTTNEDLEVLLNDAFPEQRIEFVPAGVLGELKALMRCLNTKRPPFAGAHPNCESMYLMVSDGERFVPLSHYLRGSVPDLVRGLFEADARLVRAEARVQNTATGGLLRRLGLSEPWLKLRAALAVVGVLRRHVRLDTLLRGRGRLGKGANLVMLAARLTFGHSTRATVRRHMNTQGVLQVIVLPFEDQATLETERLERCPNAFAYYDPECDEVSWVPTCAWGEHKVPVMRRISEHYASRAAPEASLAG